MQGKDYNVSYIDNLMVFQAACTRISQIQEVLGKLAEDVTNLIETDTFTGSAADNIKAYAQEVQLPLISSVSTMLTEYQSKLMLYYTGYYDIDDDYSTKFCADTMDKYQQKADKYDNANTAVRDEIAKSLSKISNIIALNTPSQEPLKTDLNWISKKIDILDRLIIEYEDGHSTDLDSLNEFIANINDFITYYNDNINAGEYKSGDVSSCTYAYLLYQSVMLSQEFINGNQARIQNASDKLNAIGDQMQADYEAACQARVDQGRAELIKGLAVVVVGCLAIAASGGAATPLVGAALFTTGSCTFLYGASNAVEGAQDIYYGMNGDLSSYAYNPIRDTVFMGNQQLYDLWGNANLMIAGTLTAGNQAMLAGMGEGLEGAALAKATSIAVAKNMAIGYLGDKATGATVNFLDERFDLNMTEEALLELGLGIAFDPDTYKNIGDIHAKMHADSTPNTRSLSDIANASALPDNEISFMDLMSPEDAARYDKWSIDCANGTHNNFPGLDDLDIQNWKFADGQVANASALASIDGNELLALRGQNVKVDGTNNYTAGIDLTAKNAASTDTFTAVSRDQRATESLRNIGRQAGYSDAVVDRYISNLESDVHYNIEKTTKTQWGDGWDDLTTEEQQILKDVVSDKATTDKALAETKFNGARTLLEYKQRFDQGIFDSKNYSLDDILNLKIDRNANAKSYAGISNSEYLPRADEFISDDGVVNYVKELCPTNDNIARCTNIQEMANELSSNPVKLELVTFQDASIDGANILSFDGNFGNVSASLETGGGTFSLPKSKLEEFAIKYDDICTIENGKFIILDQKRFGEEVLSGVQLNAKDGAYMIATEVPLDGSNIGMPSVNNWSSYMDYFVSGGKLLSGEIEITQKPLHDIISNSSSIGTNELTGTSDGVKYTITHLQ